MVRIFTYWNFDPFNAGLMVAMIIGYCWLTRCHINRRTVFFATAMFLLGISLFSPLHFLGAHYLFSAHMICHVMTVLIVAPLIVAGIPPRNESNKGAQKASAKMPVFLFWLAGVGVMWIWHIPVIFNYMFSMDGMWLMHLESVSLLVAGMLFAWPVTGPHRDRRLPPLKAVLYLSTACLFCSLLGLMITFSTPGTYTPFLTIADHWGLSVVIRNEWRISIAADQQAAGLIMWVPGCIIYLTASMLLLVTWLGEERMAQRGVRLGNDQINSANIEVSPHKI